MVLSTSQQVALAFTAVLFTFVVLPRLFGAGGGTSAKDTKFDPRYNKKGKKCLNVSFPARVLCSLNKNRCLSITGFTSHAEQI